LLVLGLAGTAQALAAQNSVYGVQGIGFPIRPLSVYTRGMGGGNGVFDPGSGVNPAAVADIRERITAALSAATAFRRYAAYDSTVSGLRETRFPLSMVAAPIAGLPLSLAVSYGPYLERSFDFRSSSVVVVRAESLIVSDRISSDGGIADFRTAVGLLLGQRVRLGVAGHVLTGSSKMRVVREFSNSSYRTFGQQNYLTFTGAGVSVGASAWLFPGVRLAAALRSDSRLRTTQEGFPTTTVDLPVTASAGLMLLPTRGFMWATTAERRSWSSSAADLSTGTTAFDTWSIASGLDLGGLPFPLRLGGRYGTLPFSGRESQAHEYVLSAGTGRVFVLQGGRAAMDLSVERTSRAGAGASESAWQVSVGLAIQP
jgi:hypothetical protein